MKRLVIILVFLLETFSQANTSGGCTREISIQPEKDEQIYSSGSNFSLTCSSYSKIKWILPDTLIAQRYTIQNILRGHCNMEKLTILNATFANVGFYVCQEINDNVLFREVRPDRKRVYIYIKNEEDLTAKLRKSIINAVENENVIIPCKPAFPAVQMSLYQGGTQVYPRNGSRWQFHPQRGFTLDAVSVDDSGSIGCVAEYNSGTTSIMAEERIMLNVLPSPYPLINSSEAVNIAVNDPLKLNCSITIDETLRRTTYKGNPFHLKWIIPDENGTHKGRVQVQDKQLPRMKAEYVTVYKNLLITRSTRNDQGNYTCVFHDFKNITHSTSIYIAISNQGSNPSQTILPVVMSVAVMIVSITAVIVLVRIYLTKNRPRTMERYQLKQLLKRNSQYVQFNRDEQTLLPSYNKKLEFPRNQLKLGKQLGSGAFGIVVEAEAYGLGNEISCIVAVKMAKCRAQMAGITALSTELKMMAHIGSHLNIVNLLGACTKNISRGELLVIVEYCRFGNIRQFLLRNRQCFIHQTDEGNSSEMNNESTSLITVTNTKEGARVGSSNETDPQTSTVLHHDHPSSDTITLRSDDERTNNTNPMPSTSSREDMDYVSNYCTTEDLEPVQAITSQDLMNWSFQIARGMNYLASKQILHGDLAARNILLAENNIIKISDFGLSRDMYHYGDYRKKGDGPMPIKWMALESILDDLFSTKSDVWSFGIVLWEMFSLGKSPYPGIEPEKLATTLLTGYRLEKPKYANHFIYNIMNQCWTEDPQRRPTFSDLENKLDQQMEDAVRDLYTQLDKAYTRPNGGI